jgi:hypothetical protein
MEALRLRMAQQIRHLQMAIPDFDFIGAPNKRIFFLFQKTALENNSIEDLIW